MMRDQFRRSPVTRPAMPTPSANPDKHNNGIPAKPFTPTLSSAFRPTAKSPLPLTPRLAHLGNTQTPKRPESSVVPPPREDVATPDPTYLGINITPRSGPRSSRRDGYISSPEITSAATHAGSYTSRSTAPVIPGYIRSERSPVRGYPRSEISKSTVLRGSNIDGPGSRTVPRPPSSSEQLNSTSKFFHADEARSTGSHEAEARPRTLSKPAQASTFFYADGSHDQDSHTDDSSKGVLPKRRSTGSSRLPVGAKSPSVLSPRLRTAQLVDPISRSSSESSLQPSPNIEEVSMSGTTLPAEHHFPGLTTRTPQLPPHPTHRKSCSVDSTTNIASPRVTSRRVTPTSSSPFLPEPLSSPPEQFSHSPLITSNPLIQLTDHQDQPYTVPQSPVKIDGGSNAFGEDAINARTERKVLDLEISNSSLLAINRTLERELRKQNAELRRFRRLSRSGRLSITTSLRSTSGGGLSVVSETGDISELSSTYSNDEMSDDSDQDSIDDGIVSPNSLAEHDSRHRVDDEKQFMLDLAKHQELLIDSQKLNQSLKRCIGWTEELIKEGKKALEYNVHVNDIEIGGRVLDPDELGEELDRGHGLLSPAAEVRGDFEFSALDALDDVLEENGLLEDPIDLNVESEQ